MATFIPTDEQTAALDLFATGESLAIEAGAGTGKTSTLIHLANATDRRGQYIAFNKAIVTDAQAKMPSHVKARTAHSLAFGNVVAGTAFGDRLGSSARMRSDQIAKLLDVRAVQVEGKRLSPGYLAGVVMRSIVKFCQTADEEPSTKHVPYIDGIDVPKDGIRTYANNDLVRQWLKDPLQKAWADIMDPEGQLPYRHDHYLKQWQLRGPKIGADFILFDEAQDANPVMVAIVAAQKHAQLVWVGDSQQQIYGFTGAVNALANVPADHRTFLTQSFRFGPEIADEANQVLGMLEAELRIVGTDSISSIVAPVLDPDVILTRTNATAVREVLNAQTRGRSVHLVGGGNEIVNFAKAAQELMDGRPTIHPELACFDSWGEVQEYVEMDEQGAELRLLTRLVDEFSVPVILKALDRMPREDSAELIVSTAHKSKGREWKSVQLGGDFPDEVKGAEELRLLYVSITRAQHELDIDNVPILRGL